MSGSYVKIRRHPYEEPYHTQLEFFVSNGRFSSTFDLYCNVEDITLMGKALKGFPRNSKDEYSYIYGSDKLEDKFYRYFKWRVYITDLLGHCALQFIINLNGKEPQEGLSTFSIAAEAAAINRLGNLLEQFGELKHLELQWNGVDGELYETHIIE
jgi:hypothetical protein